MEPASKLSKFSRAKTIDFQGVKSVKELGIPCKYVLITPPLMEAGDLIAREGDADRGGHLKTAGKRYV